MPTIKKNINSLPFLTAILDKSSLNFEKLEVLESVINNFEKGVTKIGHITNTTFEFGVPKDQKNTTFLIRVKYGVELLNNQEKIKFCTYDSMINTTFKVLNSSGIDWKDVPENILAPYFSFAHSLARRRAEEHLLTAGYPGIILPLPKNLDIHPN